MDWLQTGKWRTQAERMAAKVGAYGVRDERILQALREIPRHRFLPRGTDLVTAYGDHPCGIGHGQTISQPYIVAYMTERLALGPGQRVLELGSGCGYQTAILAWLGLEVYALERIPELVRIASLNLATVLPEADHLHLKWGDGYQGWAEAAPFAGILAACAPPEVPPALVAQLAAGGRLVLPVGTHRQSLRTLELRGGDLHQVDELPVRFVPMVPGKSEEA